MIEDRQLEGNNLDDVLEKIYYQVSNNKISNLNVNVF